MSSDGFDTLPELRGKYEKLNVKEEIGGERKRSTAIMSDESFEKFKQAVEEKKKEWLLNIVCKHQKCGENLKSGGFFLMFIIFFLYTDPHFHRNAEASESAIYRITSTLNFLSNLATMGLALLCAWMAKEMGAITREQFEAMSMEELRGIRASQVRFVRLATMAVMFLIGMFVGILLTYGLVTKACVKVTAKQLLNCTLKAMAQNEGNVTETLSSD